jgi:hypothetical protein
MSIKLRILLLQAMVGIAVVVMAGVAFAAIKAMTGSLERIRWSNRQLDAATQLQVLANRYSEQVAELLLVGASERVDFDDARDRVTAWFRASQDLSRREIASLRDPAAQGEERVELERLERMRTLFQQIDRSAERLLLLNQEGRQQEAIALFTAQIENRLDAELENLIAAAVADERLEAARVNSESAQLARRLMIGTIAVLAAILAVSILLAVRFHAVIAPPLRALNDAASAMRRRRSGGATWATASATRSRTRSAGSRTASIGWRSSSSASADASWPPSRSSKFKSPSAPLSWRRPTAGSRSSTSSGCASWRTSATSCAHP